MASAESSTILSLRLGNLENRVHVARQARDMYRHDGARPRRDMPFDLSGVDTVVIRLHVHKDRLQPVIENDVRSRYEGHRRYEDLIAIPPAVLFFECRQRDMKCACAAVTHQSVVARMGVCNQPLKLLHFRACRQPARIQGLPHQLFRALRDDTGPDADLRAGSAFQYDGILLGSNH